MKYSLQTDNITLSDADQTLLDKKLNRLAKFLQPPYTIDLRIQRDRHHAKGEVIMVRVNIEHGKRVTHAERSAGTIQDAVDAIIDVLRRDLIRQRARGRRSNRFLKRFLSR